MTWLHKAPSNEKSTAKKNSLIWSWCDKYIRYTGHKSIECTKLSKREKCVGFAGVASAYNNVDSNISMVSSVGWSDEEYEYTTPCKKSRTKCMNKNKIVVLPLDEESDSDK